MKTRQVTERLGENLGPIDWDYDFAACGWDKGGSLNPEMIPAAVERLRQMENGEWQATTDGGWPRVGWKRVVAVAMYDGWPHWKPVPSICLAGIFGAEWHSWYSITSAEKLP